MSDAIMRMAKSTLIGLLMGGSVTTMAASLNIANDPLFLGYTVDPNVFFMLDDSGSMDWEITTTPHWDACGYDASYPNTTCTPSLRSDGGFYLYRWRDRKLSTQTSWSANGSTGTTLFQYIFSNTDNLYGMSGGANACDQSQTSLASCVASLANSASTTQNQTCSGPSTCNAPTGYEFTYCSGNAGTSQRKCGWYTPYNHRWSVYAKDWRAYSSDLNVTYYNPGAVYAAWLGTGMTDATFSSVRSNPQTGQAGYSLTRDLNGEMGDIYRDITTSPITTGFVYEVWKDTHGYTGLAPAKTNRSNGANGYVDMWDEHVRYVVSGSVASPVVKYTPITYTSTLGVLTEVPGTTVTMAATDVDQFGNTPAKIVQNVANWYQYSRRRMLMAKATIGDVVTKNSDFRFGLSVINMNATSAVGTTGTSSDNSKIFMLLPTATETTYSTHNTNLLTHLYKFISPAEGTPLRSGLDNAGRYYAGQKIYNTNANTISGTTLANPMTESCQQNYAVLVTDGYWTTDADPATTIGDRDLDGYKNSDSTQKATVADVARYYADHDLHASYPNNVPVFDRTGKKTNDETFQHMITFTAAFGVRGELSDSNEGTAADDGDYLPTLYTDISTLISTAFAPKTNVKWGKNPWSYDSGKIDDLWHAAFNSNGDFISARTPQDLSDGLDDAMSKIDNQLGSSASVAASSGSYRTDTLLFLAKFTSGDWTGNLEAYALTANADGEISISTTASWDAADKLGDQVEVNGFVAGRQILSYNPTTVNGSRQGKGIAFNFPSPYDSATADQMSPAQIQKLIPNSISTTDSLLKSANQTTGTNLINWMRGDRSNEGTTLRERESLLGDIVNSAPQYVAKPTRLYPDLLEAASYSKFREDNASRSPMIYVGANDGMLHAFNAATGSTGGQEVFAYVPSAVYGKLTNLASPTFTHKYLVDGSIEVNDAFIGGSWRTVLLAGLSGGGQGVYALDVTNGSSASEANPTKTVMWEFTDTNYVASTTAGAAGSNGDPNLGYTYSRPQIVKMHNGKWVAIFGNGYNNTEADGSASTTGYAYLYFVDLDTGKLLKRIEVPTGNTTTPNGLSTVAAIDFDGDYKADYVYGGDLYGNMWRFDVADSTEANWKLGHGGKPLFTTSTVALEKPITVKPSVSRHPAGIGVMVYFGSGKYLENIDADSDDKVTQTFYGVWDNLGNDSLVYPVPQNTLLQQTIDEEVQHSSGAEVRITSDKSIDWSTQRGWYMDLAYKGANGGELVATDSVVRGDRVIFISIMPAESPCETGGTSWIYELDFASGAHLPYSPIDVNGDGTIDALDKVVSSGGSDVAGGGFKSDNILTSPTILSDTTSSSEEHKVLSTSAGTFMKMGESTDGMLGRRSWRQLH